MRRRAAPIRSLRTGLAFSVVLMLVGVPAASAEVPQPAVSGHVTDVSTGAPIAGANVALFVVHPPPSPIASTTTDANGYYEFTGIGGADFVLAWHDDYEQNNARPPGTEEPLYDGTAPVVADIQLWPMVGDPPVRGTVTYGPSGAAVHSGQIARVIVYEDEGFWNNAIGTVYDGEYAFWRVYPHRPFRIHFLMDGYHDHVSDVLVWNDGIGPQSRDGCMVGAWQGFGFRNQGQCIRFVNTGQDSRGPTQVVHDIVIWPVEE